MQLLLSFLLVAIQSSTRNAELKRSNTALLQALKALTEQQVGAVEDIPDACTFQHDDPSDSSVNFGVKRCNGCKISTQESEKRNFCEWGESSEWCAELNGHKVMPHHGEGTYTTEYCEDNGVCSSECKSIYDNLPFSCPEFKESYPECSSSCCEANEVQDNTGGQENTGGQDNTGEQGNAGNTGDPCTFQHDDPTDSGVNFGVKRCNGCKISTQESERNFCEWGSSPKWCAKLNGRKVIQDHGKGTYTTEYCEAICPSSDSDDYCDSCLLADRSTSGNQCLTDYTKKGCIAKSGKVCGDNFPQETNPRPATKPRPANGKQNECFRCNCGSYNYSEPKGDRVWYTVCVKSTAHENFTVHCRYDAGWNLVAMPGHWTEHSKRCELLENGQDFEIDPLPKD